MRPPRLLWPSFALCWLSLAGLDLLAALRSPHHWDDAFAALLDGYCLWQVAGLAREALK